MGLPSEFTLIGLRFFAVLRMTMRGGLGIAMREGVRMTVAEGFGMTEERRPVKKGR